MYKVFIQNKPLFFVNVEKIQLLDGIFIRQSLANTNKEYVMSLLNNSSKDIPIMLFSENPEEGISIFFEDFDFVEAAGGIVRRKEKYLFIKRNGIWDIPKGKMEFGESPEESAIREIEEECGVLCDRVEELITITYHTYVYDGKPTIKKTYWFALDFEGKKKLTAQKEEGITKAKWLKKDKVLELKGDTFPSIVDVIVYYFAD